VLGRFTERLDLDATRLDLRRSDARAERRISRDGRDQRLSRCATSIIRACAEHTVLHPYTHYT